MSSRTDQRLSEVIKSLGAKRAKLSTEKRMALVNAYELDHCHILKDEFGNLFAIDAPYASGLEGLYLEPKYNFYFPGWSYVRLTKPNGSEADLLELADRLCASGVDFSDEFYYLEELAGERQKSS